MTRLLKYLVFGFTLFLSLSSAAQTPTGTKTRTPGIWLSSKDTAINRTAADSIQIIANRADSSLRFYWSVGAPSRKIAFANDISNSYVPYTDAGTVNFKINKPFSFKSSAGATRYYIDDIDNFNFKLNGSGFDLSAYTRFQITDAIGTRFAIGGDGAISGLSGTFSSLTNRRVPFISTAGLLKDTTGFTWAGSFLSVPGSIEANGDVYSIGSGKGFYGQYLDITDNVTNSIAVVTNTNANGGGAAIQGGNNLAKPTLKLFGYSGDSIANINPIGAYFYKPIYGTISTAAQPNITSLGSLTALTMSGGVNMQSNDITNGGDFSFTNGTATSNMRSKNYNVFEASASRGGLYTYNQIVGSGTDYAVGIFSEADVWIAPSGSATKTVNVNGSLLTITTPVTAPSVYTTTVGGTNRDLFVDDAGVIGYVSSIRASKKNIQPFTNPNWVNDLQPVTFNYRVKDTSGAYTDSAYKELEYGLIAEEVEKINPELVFYDVDSTGKHLRGVSYSKLIIPILKQVQNLKKENDVIKGELADLKELLKSKGIL